jgi:LysM repeat protein
VPGSPDDHGDPATTVPEPVGAPTEADPLRAICPFLRSVDGTWRSLIPTHGQTCWAVAPPAPLPIGTQVELCCTRAHDACERYVAAVGQRLGALAADHVAPGQLEGRFGVRVLPRPLVLDHVRVVPQVADRGRLAAALATAGVLVVVAIVAVALSGLLRGAPPAATLPIVARATDTAGPSGSPAPTPPSSAVASQAPTPTPSPTPIPTPTPRVTPPIARTYRVRPKDTLASIAQEFGVTQRALRQVNDLGRPPMLVVGQLLNIPVSASPSPSSGAPQLVP